MNKKSPMEIIFKILVVISSFIGLYLNFRIAPISKMILYFTILSNLFIFLFYSISFILYSMNKLRKNKFYYILKGMVTVNITLTMVVYNVALTGNNFYHEYPLAGIFVHIITPLLVIFDYIIFGEKGNLKKTYPIYWAISLIGYTILCYVFAQLGGTYMDGSSYPYYFTDFDKNGVLKSLINGAFILIVYILYSYFVLYLDNLVYKRKMKKNQN